MPIHVVFKIAAAKCGNFCVHIKVIIDMETNDNYVKFLYKILQILVRQPSLENLIGIDMYGKVLNFDFDRLSQEDKERIKLLSVGINTFLKHTFESLSSEEKDEFSNQLNIMLNKHKELQS